MRLVDGYGQKEVFIPMIVQKINGSVDAFMGKCKFRREIPLLHALRFARHYPIFIGQFFKIVPSVVPVFIIPALRTSSQAKVIGAVQMPFPDIGGVDTFILQSFADGMDIVAQSGSIGPAAVRMRIHPGKNT